MTQRLRRLRVGYLAPLSDASAFRERPEPQPAGRDQVVTELRLAEAAYPRVRGAEIQREAAFGRSR
jgi:hypothetical protein